MQCEKIASSQTAMIKSKQLGPNGKFLIKDGFNAEVVLSGFNSQNISFYRWSILPLSAPFQTQLTQAWTRVNTSQNLNLSQRSLSVKAEDLVVGVTYRLQVVFVAGGETYKATETITPFTNADVVSLESQGFPVNLIRLTSSTVKSGEDVSFKYTLQEVKLFQNSSWVYKTYSDYTPTQSSSLINGEFVIKTPLVSADTQISITFDVTDGIITYRTTRQLMVQGVADSETILMQRFDALRAISSYTSWSNFANFPALLKNLKNLVRADPT